MAVRQPTEEDATAVHEAAHATAAFVYSRGLYSVSIVADEDSWGRVVRGRLIRKLGNGYEPSRRQRQSLEDAIVISLVGPIAEERHTGNWNDSGASSDIHSATRLLMSLGLGSNLQEQRYLHFLEQVARDLVDCHWPQIEYVANVLQAEKKLSPTAVRKAIREAFIS